MRPASSFLDIARTLALKAAERAMTLRRGTLVHMQKTDKSLVTNADHEADRIIRDGLRKAFPDHTILTEENGLDGPPDAEYVWMVDPIDGTKAFAEGIPGFSVMVGLSYRGKPYAGVVVDPLEGHIYEASQGEGTFHTLNKVRRKVHVSRRNELDHMLVITSTSFPKTFEKKLKEPLPGRWIPPVNSVGIKVGFMVRGLADIYINHHGVHLWDTCAPQIILEEAGGTMTNWDGAPLDYSLNKGTYKHDGLSLATNGLCHSDVVEILRQLS